jgi:hypothetical protein
LGTTALQTSQTENHKKIQPSKLRFDVGGVGRGDDYVGPKYQEGADSAFRPERIQELVGALAFVGQILRIDAPNLGHSGPMIGIFDQAVSRQLIGLLSLLPTALSVALPCERAISAGRLAHLAERQHQVDERENGVSPLGLLLRSPTRKDHARLGFGEQKDGTKLLFD